MIGSISANRLETKLNQLKAFVDTVYVKTQESDPEKQAMYYQELVEIMGMIQALEWVLKVHPSKKFNPPYFPTERKVYLD